jgi:uncharacterized protein YndB with AHSA1/START domain
MSEGILDEVDGRPALRFTRRLPHPVERVWRAVSARDELAAWFVAPLDLTGPGGRFEAMEEPGQVLRAEPPRLLELEWGGETLRFELEEDGAGTLLTFVHVFADAERAANYASGWHAHFDRLDAHLAGKPVLEPEPARLVALNDLYAERFGVDPEVGRRLVAEHYGGAT